MESEETYMEKTFQMINELTGHTTLITLKVQYIPSTREINISRALYDIAVKGFSLANSHIFYLDMFKRMFVHLGTFPFRQEVLLKFELFLETNIKIRYRKLAGTDSPNSSHRKTQCEQRHQLKNGPSSQLRPSYSNSVPEAGYPGQMSPQLSHQKLPQRKNQSKKTRSQRTVQEVVVLVERWREIYETKDISGKRLYTLDEAAEKIGEPRKTLDDYYYKLKSAKAYGFDFGKHGSQKIGYLRQFVKKCVKEKAPKNSLCSESTEPNSSSFDDGISKYLAGDSSGSPSSDNESSERD